MTIPTMYLGPPAPLAIRQAEAIKNVDTLIRVLMFYADPDNHMPPSIIGSCRLGSLASEPSRIEADRGRMARNALALMRNNVAGIDPSFLPQGCSPEDAEARAISEIYAMLDDNVIADNVPPARLFKLLDVLENDEAEVETPSWWRRALNVFGFWRKSAA